MSPIEVEVIYENGVLRPLHPLDIAEGTRLEVTMSRIVRSPSELEQVDDEAYTAFLREFDKIAALPLESPSQPHIARDHDAILYPTEGTMP
jgi:predicted DNA-binding antitoxin AbrB/MazE fold protein